jgi:molybdopterin synthase catalytic subunit
MNYPTLYSITEDEMDINNLLEQITLTSTGAAAIFTGVVRGVDYMYLRPAGYRRI